MIDPDGSANREESKPCIKARNLSRTAVGFTRSPRHGHAASRVKLGQNGLEMVVRALTMAGTGYEDGVVESSSGSKILAWSSREDTRSFTEKRVWRFARRSI